MSLTSDQAIARGVSAKVALARITAGERLYHWTAGSVSGTWWSATSNHVVDVKEDSSSLQEVTSEALCGSTAGSWCWDRAAGRVYVNPLSDDDPYAHTIQAVVEFRYSNHPKVVEGLPYTPRLTETPKLDVRIPAKFTDGFKNGGGNLTVSGAQGSDPSAAGLFDGLADLDWDAGAVIVLAGADPVW